MTDAKTSKSLLLRTFNIRKQTVTVLLNSLMSAKFFATKRMIGCDIGRTSRGMVRWGGDEYVPDRHRAVRAKYTELPSSCDRHSTVIMCAL